MVEVSIFYKLEKMTGQTILLIKIKTVALFTAVLFYLIVAA